MDVVFQLVGPTQIHNAMRPRSLIFCSGLVALPLHAQLLAGEVPDGGTALDLDIHIELPTPFTADSSALEIDCDDFFDMTVTLIHGQPAVDAPNVALLRMVDDDLELCADGVPNQSRPRYYTFGQTIDCNGGFDWQPDDITTLGDIGSFTAFGPMAIDSQYVAFKRGEQLGWILLSFDLTGQTPWLRIHRALSICAGPTHVPSTTDAPMLVLYPNPCDGRTVRVEGSGPWQRLELLDATGRQVMRSGAATRTIPVPEVPGTYLVRATDADGRSAMSRLVRY